MKTCYDVNINKDIFNFVLLIFTYSGVYILPNSQNLVGGKALIKKEGRGKFSMLESKKEGKDRKRKGEKEVKCVKRGKH